MDVDIDDLYEKYQTWKKDKLEKDQYIHMLQEQLKISREEKEALNSILKNLLEDMSNTHKVLLELKDNLERYKMYESEIKQLHEEKEALSEKLQHQEESYEKKISDMNNQAAILKTMNAKKIKDIEEEMISQKEQAVSSMQNKLEECHKKMSELEEIIQSHENEKKRSLHLQNEFEKQFLQMKEQLSRAKETSLVPSVNEEIFRNKYENLKIVEAENKEEIKRLKKEIEELKQLNERIVMANRLNRQIRTESSSQQNFPFSTSPLINPLSQLPSSVLKNKYSTPNNPTAVPSQSASFSSQSADKLYESTSHLKDVNCLSADTENVESHKRKKCVKRRKLFNIDCSYLNNLNKENTK